jgi:dephospho-CoA kinase
VTLTQWPAIVAVLGLSGTGKSEAARWLAESRGYHRVYFGGIVVDEVRRRGLAGPEQERVVREELRREHGMGAMAVLSLPAILEHVDRDEPVVIDGLYSAAEREILVEHFGDALVTLAVHAPRWLRKQRLAQRATRPLTSAEVDARDEFEVRNLDKAVPIVEADLHVVNDSDLDALFAAVETTLSSRPVS